VAIALAMAGWGRGAVMSITRINPLTRRRAQELRRAMTPPERSLWKLLRELKQFGFHFRRQTPIGPYVADFAELTHKLIIELDGESHGDPQAQTRDAQRDRFLAKSGFRILRISNREITANSAGVAEHILQMVRSDE
jgi:very-short-patch-repair endonuclease